VRTSEQVLAVVVLVLVTGCCLPLARRERPGRAAGAWAIATIVLVLWWFRHKAPYEGPAIIKLTPSNGVTVVDMIVPPGLAIAGCVLLRVRWRRRPSDRQSPDT